MFLAVPHGKEGIAFPSASLRLFVDVRPMCVDFKVEMDTFDDLLQEDQGAAEQLQTPRDTERC